MGSTRNGEGKEIRVEREAEHGGRRGLNLNNGKITEVEVLGTQSSLFTEAEKDP